MFHPLPHVKHEELPQRFTYPFHYEAHPLCRLAAEKLQKKLSEWQWDKLSIGKMFGVLLARNPKGEIGFLCAYSGNPTANMDKEFFVPPIFDYLDEDTFFFKGEQELIGINQDIQNLIQDSDFQNTKANHEEINLRAEREIKQQKEFNKQAKHKRQQRRLHGKNQLNKEDFTALELQLNRESQHQKAELKRLQKHWNQKIETARIPLVDNQQQIKSLKTLRQEKSASLQNQLFEQYQLLNAQLECKGLSSIFQEYDDSYPPAASGDCAAPRLLQYAYSNHLHPLAMAEFWWGKSPKTVIRKAGRFYPSCRSKCEPILSHMLKGLEVEKNPLISHSHKEISIIYEDDVLMVINKPAGLLSVPGKTKQKCIAEVLTEMRNDLKDIFIVHRLDMTTSGLLLIAKNEKIYKLLQQQFLEGKVQKRYEALLDGIIKKEKGKIELPLRVDLDNRPQQMVCFDHGKPALTIWKKIKVTDGKTRYAEG